jgi:methyl-accepting chemotaxis protein
MRLATGFLCAGLIALLAAVLVDLVPLQSSGLAANLQEQFSASNADLTTALALFQANESHVHLALEDAATGQPRSVLLSDQTAIQDLATQFVEEIDIFLRGNLLVQQPAQAERLAELGQGEVIEQQYGLVMSITYAWQRYHAAQNQLVQDLLDNQLSGAEMLARFPVSALETNVLSALYNLIQFQHDLELSVRYAAHVQALHQQQIVTLLGAFSALALIALVGFLISMSLVLPLHRLQRVTQAAAAGENEARVAVIGHDEVADISSRVNDFLASIDGLLAEVQRQHQGQLFAAETLVTGLHLGEEGAVRAQTAEVGDTLRVLDRVCSDAIARFQDVVSSARMAAQELEAGALRAKRLEETLVSGQQGHPGEFAGEVGALARQLESIASMLSAPLPAA